MINDGSNLGHQECLNDQKIEILIQLSANITRHHGGCCVINLKKAFYKLGLLISLSEQNITNAFRQAESGIYSLNHNKCCFNKINYGHTALGIK